MPITPVEHFDTVRPFHAFCLIKSASEDPDTGEWLVSGPVASHKEDYDGEVLEKSGVWKGLDMHEKLGSQVDIEHLFGESVKKGKPDYDLIVGQGIKKMLVNGVPWLTTRLRKSNEHAQKIWKALKDGIQVGYSIEGISKARDPKNSKRVLETEIHRVTLSVNPKGFDARVHMGSIPVGSLSKALTTIVEEFESGEAANWSPYLEEMPAEVIKAMSVDGQSVAVGGKDHRHLCPDCGGSMYCIHCHNASKKAVMPQGTDIVPQNTDVNGEINKSANDESAEGAMLSKCPKCDKKLTKAESKAKFCNDCDCDVNALHKSDDMMGDCSDEDDESMKALTTGEGIVTAGAGAPGDGSKLRTQSMKRGTPVSTTVEARVGKVVKDKREEDDDKPAVKRTGTAKKAVTAPVRRKPDIDPTEVALRKAGAPHAHLLAQFVRRTR